MGGPRLPSADVAELLDWVDHVSVEERVVLEWRVAAVFAAAVLGVELVLAALAVAAGGPIKKPKQVSKL